MGRVLLYLVCRVFGDTIGRDVTEIASHFLFGADLKINLEKTMRILISGGIGFIGSSLALALSKLKNHVIIIDRRDNNKGEKIYEKNNYISFYRGDIRDRYFISSILEKESIDGIIHLAAISRVIDAEKNPTDCLSINVEGYKSIIEKASLVSYKKPWIIFGSSREVYGSQTLLPVTENVEKKYVNIYGKSKLQGEKLTKEYFNNNNVSALILRFSNVYGNKFDILDRVIPKFIISTFLEKPLVIEGGGQVIDFTHIDDTVATIIKSIEYISGNDKIFDDFHILPGKGKSLYELIEIIESVLGKKATIKVNNKRNYDVEKFIGDPSKRIKILNKSKFLSLEEGIRKSIPNYLGDLK
ncbi:MAG: hypothetical protein CSA15_08155 [Candidatus Delongbacteria bacterium]|nr:MAG: hypothetical protein CSA15_08155 [Candidatus Delongbacteria bacterium]